MLQHRAVVVPGPQAAAGCARLAEDPHVGGAERDSVPGGLAEPARGRPAAPLQRSARPAPLVCAVKAHTLPGALDAAAVTRSPVWPGNGTAAQVRPVSRHATGRARVDANAQAFRVPVAVTAVMPGRLRQWVVLTMRHDGAAAAGGGRRAARRGRCSGRRRDRGQPAGQRPGQRGHGSHPPPPTCVPRSWPGWPGLPHVILLAPTHQAVTLQVPGV